MVSTDRIEREAAAVARLVVHEEAQERAHAAALLVPGRVRARLARHAARSRDMRDAGAVSPGVVLLAACGASSLLVVVFVARVLGALLSVVPS